MPRYATWRRSSKGSPRFAKRRARWDASGLCASISSFRSLRSFVRRYSTNIARSLSRSSAVNVIAARSVGRQVAHAHEPCRAVGYSQFVLVAHRVEDLRGELIEFERSLVRDRCLSFDTEVGAGRVDRDRELARRLSLDDGARQLVDCNPQVLDLVDVETKAAGHGRRREPNNAHVIER